MADARDCKRSIARVTAAVAAVTAVLTAGAARAEEQPSAAAEPATPSPAKDTGGADAPIDPRVQNPANYEFAFVSVGAYQTWSLAGDKLYFGAGGGLGPPLYRYSKLGQKKAGWDPNLEIAYANVFLRVSPSKNIDIDVGPRIGLGSALYDVIDPPQSVFVYGGYVDLRIGSRTVKVGPRFQFDRAAYSDYTETGWRFTPLMVRVVH